MSFRISALGKAPETSEEAEEKEEEEEEEEQKDPPPSTPNPSSFLSFPPHDFASLIFKGPGETFAWRSERRAEKVMLTSCWLDAECCLVQYGRGRIQSEEVSTVFGRADERDGEGVERRSAVIFTFRERFVCGYASNFKEWEAH